MKKTSINNTTRSTKNNAFKRTYVFLTLKKGLLFLCLSLSLGGALNAQDVLTLSTGDLSMTNISEIVGSAINWKYLNRSSSEITLKNNSENTVASNNDDQLKAPIKKTETSSKPQKKKSMQKKKKIKNTYDHDKLSWLVFLFRGAKFSSLK